MAGMKVTVLYPGTWKAWEMRYRNTCTTPYEKVEGRGKSSTSSSTWISCTSVNWRSREYAPVRATLCPTQPLPLQSRCISCPRTGHSRICVFVFVKNLPVYCDSCVSTCIDYRKAKIVYFSHCACILSQ